MNELSNAHSAPPPPEGLARGVALLLDKRLSKYGLTFDCKAYIDQDGDTCVQVYVDNDDDPRDYMDLHYAVEDDTPDELYALIKEDLEETYEFS